MRKDGRWTVDELAARFDEVGQEPHADPRRARRARRRGEERREAEPVAHANATPSGRCGSARGRASPRSRSCRGRARRDVPARLRDAVRVVAAPRRRVRRVAAHARGVPRGTHDRGAPRAPVGQPARAARVPRRPQATVDLARHRPADRPQRPPHARQPARRALRDRPRRRGRARPHGSSPASTTARARPAARLPLPARRDDRRRLDEARLAPYDRDRADGPGGGAGLVLLASLRADPRRAAARRGSCAGPRASACSSTSG